MQTGGKTWSEDLQRYEYQRRDRANWPVPDPNPRSGPLVEIDPYRGTGVPQQQRFGANHGRDTLRDEFRDPERQRQMLEAEAAAATRTKLKQVPGTGPYAGGLRHPPRGENNREGREHLFDALQHVAAGAPTPGLDTAGRSNPDSWIGMRNYDPNKGRRFAPNDGTTRDKGQPLDAGRPDLFTVVQPRGTRAPCRRPRHGHLDRQQEPQTERREKSRHGWDVRTDDAQRPARSFRGHLRAAAGRG